MMHHVSAVLIRTVPFVLLPVLSGCAGALFATGTAATVAVLQERSIEEATEDLESKAVIEESLLQEHFDNLFRHVSVIVVEGRVLLTGTVPSEEYLRKAVEIAGQPPRVREILNELQVGPSPGTRVEDTRISLEIRARLIATKEILQRNYWVTTENGIVYMIGIAQDEVERDRAIEVARYVKDVRKVVNYVLLSDDPRRISRPRSQSS